MKLPGLYSVEFLDKNKKGLHEGHDPSAQLVESHQLFRLPGCS